MIGLLAPLVSFLLFPVVAGLGVRRWPRARAPLFAVTGILGLLALCAAGGASGVHRPDLARYLVVVTGFWATYVVAALIGFWLTARFARAAGALPWLAVLFPIVVLAVSRYVPLRGGVALDGRVAATYLIGVSYVAFRLALLVVEVRNGVAPAPTLAEYLAFTFFLPVLSVGPITRWSTFRPYLHGAPLGPELRPRAWARIGVGAAKYFFLQALWNRLSFEGLILDGHFHGPFDLAVACVSYYLYLYLNFSGWCDIAIGTAGLLGISIDENFSGPLAARSPKEFWNRWHITLSTWTRDIVFTPLSKALSRRLGLRHTNHAIALSTFVVFLIIGVWHGTGWNYLAFGALHGMGVVSTHYYTVFLKRRLNRQQWAAYQQNRAIRSLAIVGTFSFVAATMFVFANSPSQMRRILEALR